MLLGCSDAAAAMGLENEALLVLVEGELLAWELVWAERRRLKGFKVWREAMELRRRRDVRRESPSPSGCVSSDRLWSWFWFWFWFCFSFRFFRDDKGIVNLGGSRGG
jgi:hypothetical protein